MAVLSCCTYQLPQHNFLHMQSCDLVILVGLVWSSWSSKPGPPKKMELHHQIKCDTIQDHPRYGRATKRTRLSVLAACMEHFRAQHQQKRGKETRSAGNGKRQRTVEDCVTGRGKKEPGMSHFRIKPRERQPTGEWSDRRREGGWTRLALAEGRARSIICGRPLSQRHTSAKKFQAVRRAIREVPVHAPGWVAATHTRGAPCLHRPQAWAGATWEATESCYFWGTEPRPCLPAGSCPTVTGR